jgi:transcriptional regulator with XRE-family HTH domain
MNELKTRSVSLYQLIRQRRIALRLKQAMVAAELRVEPETIGHWENGRRRMELDKLPRVAAILQLNKRDLCRLALFEWHPRLYSALFGAEPPRPPRSLESYRHGQQSDRDAPASGTAGGPLEIGIIVAHSLREGEELA